MDPINTDLSHSKYVISLDAIDLNYIPTTSRYKSHEITQIWTQANLNKREDEYFEFEIKEKGLGNNDCENTNNQYAYIPCHLCNIDVPKPFLKEHFNSKKHKTFKNIIDIALGRLKKIMGGEQIFEDSNSNDSVYFCSSCVVIVKTQEKILHEKSIMHKNSLEVEKFLNDFLDLYKNEKKYVTEKAVDNNNVINNVVSWTIEKEPVVNSKKDNDLVRINKTSIDYSNNNIDIEKKVHNINIPVPLDVAETKNNLHAYINFLTDTAHLKDIKLLKNYYLEIKTISGAIVKIFEFNFNGTVKATKKNYECKLCRKTYNKKVKWDHLYEKEHVDLVTIGFEDENCIRRVDSSWSHCAVCNKGIQNEQGHINHKDHNLRLKEALQIKIHDTIDTLDTNHSNALMSNDDDTKVVSTTSEPDNKENVTKNITNINKTMLCNTQKFCKTCSMDITNDYQMHINTHKINEEIEKSDIHYLVDISDSPNKDFICKVCGTLILNSKIKVNEHVSSLHHQDNYKKLLTNNNIKEMDKYHFHCDSCDVCFDKTKELIHINNKQHQRNLSVVEIKTEQKIIETPVPNTVIMKFDDDIIKDNSFTCVICNLNMPNHNYNIYTHLTSDLHIKSVTKQTSDNVTYMHYHIDLTNFPILVCMVCNILLTGGKKSIKKHVEGSVHKQNYKLKLASEKIVIENGKLICKICSVSIPPMHELIHCETKKHIKKLSKRFEIRNVGFEIFNFIP